MWYTGRKNKKVYIIDVEDVLYNNKNKDKLVVVIDVGISHVYYNLLCMGGKYKAATMRMEQNKFLKEYTPVKKEDD